MFNEFELKNIGVLINFAFQNGMVKSQDDARVLLGLEHKVKLELQPKEDENGDNVPDSPE